MKNDQRPSLSEAGHHGEMSSFNCAAVQWALNQDVSSASSSRLLIEIARQSEGGRCIATQVSLGAACKLSERQTRTLLASLVADKAITRTRQGGTGTGRLADVYELKGYLESKQPAISADSHEATGSEAQFAPPIDRQLSPVATDLDRKSLPEGATGNAAPTPPIRTTSTLEDNLQPTEPSLNRGLGDLFEPEVKSKPKRAGTTRRPRQEKFYATEDSMPTEPNGPMGEYAASKHLLNGTRAAEFSKFRRYHIRERSLIKSLEQRWETWVDNWAQRNPVKPDGAPAGYRLGGYGDDGKPRYVKNQRTNTYR